METLEKSAALTSFIGAYDVFAATHNSTPYVNAARQAGIDALTSLGLPTKHTEDFKYTNVEGLLKTPYELAINPTLSLTTAEVATFAIPNLEATLLVVENGVFRADLSTIQTQQGITICSLGEAFANHPELVEQHFNRYTPTDDALAALNTAFALNGVFVHIARNTVANAPIVLLNVSTGNQTAMYTTRNLLVADNFAEVTFIKYYVNHTALPTLTNTLTELALGEGATVKDYRIQHIGASAQVKTSAINVSANAKYITNNITLSGQWVRNTLNIRLAGQNANAELFGLYLPNGTAMVDNHTLVDHAVPNCYSNELYKGIIGDEGTAIFNGKIFVRKDAQKTNAYQSNKNILLTDTATVNTKPQLEIYADDVKCSHGSSTGTIDTEALFYLQSRGIGADTAKALLMYAFAADIINHIDNEAMQTFVDGIVAQRFTN